MLEYSYKGLYYSYLTRAHQHKFINRLLFKKN